MDKKNKKAILTPIMIFVGMIIISFLVYKAQLADVFQKTVCVTMTTEHKPTSTIVMDATNPIISETFVCTVPDLKVIQVECVGKTINADTMIDMTVSEADTGTIYYHDQKMLSKVASKGKKKRFRMKMNAKAQDSEGKTLVIRWKLVDVQDSVMNITSNYKPGIVQSYNENSTDYTNYIYAMRYADCKELVHLYVLLCISLIVLVAMAYFFIIVKRMTVERFYIPLALFLGCIMNVVIMIHGVPDEPNHIDTAYKYSNWLLRVDSTENPGTIYKRECDAQMESMLANGVESNSYYQLYHHTWERPDNTDLIEVTYADSSNLVPGVVFMPTAIGISIGRLLGLSAILTIMLGRIGNLIVFVLMTGLAIRWIPYGKNVMALLGLLPIAVQQAASASYDAVINGTLFLFIALSIRFSTEKNKTIGLMITWIILAILVAVLKSGVYLPVLSIMLLYQGKAEDQGITSASKRKRIGWIVGIVALGGCVLAFLLYKYLPTVHYLLTATDIPDLNNGSKMYSAAYIIKHPARLVYLYWNTLMEVGDKHLRGLLGGLLEWMQVKISWLWLIVLLGSAVLFANAEGDCCNTIGKGRKIMIIACIESILLICLSMLFGFTTMKNSHITGIQGRYYLGIAPLILLPSANKMIYVKQQQCPKIWMTVILVETLIVLQFVVQVM